MKKFFYVNYACTVYGRYYTFIRHKEKQVQATIFSNPFFIIEEKDLTKTIKKQIKALIESYKEELKNKKGIYLYDFSLGFAPEVYFNTIDRYEITKIYKREATIKECIEKLTPDKYKELYGDTLKLSKGE